MNLKTILFAVVLTFLHGVSFAQTLTTHKVKKHETIFGIAREYGITIDKLIDANPVMRTPGYDLKKGDIINIPAKTTVTPQKKNIATTAPSPMKKSVDVGIMLPLHDVDGDGRRMVEYYRGILMAAEKMKSEGISINIHAWNVPIDADIRSTLLDKNAQHLDLVIGPLYTRQVKNLGDFCKKNDIRLVIPFSISGNHVDTNENVFQIYQSQQTLSEKSIAAFIERFSSYHPVFIDCNDTTSQKGIFTFALRKKLEEKGIEYNITNLNSSDQYFAKAFSLTKRNIVILNTGRSPQLTAAMRKLDILTRENKNVEISMFGYTEWQMYYKYNQNEEYFSKYDVYIPTTYYYNEKSNVVKQFEQQYKEKFGSDMMNALPHFAATGFDHAMYFIGGIYKYKKDFKGLRTQLYATPLQTPLYFTKSKNGGFRNNAFQLIHFKPMGAIESISY